MELTKRFIGYSRVERNEDWSFRSADDIPCTFPPDERIGELSSELLDNLQVKQSNLLEIIFRGENYLLLKIRDVVPINAMDAFTEALGEKTIATQTAKA